jgi:gluconokinase
MNNPPPTIIVMGVCGCGKTVVGKLIAADLGGVFDDADGFHPASNVAKMSAGTPLTDEDREPWYAILRKRIVEMRRQTRCHVLACSALKKKYREWLRDRDDASQITFIHLRGDRALIRRRMEARTDHFMPPALLDSQFATLEESADLIAVSIDQTPESIAKEAMEKALRDSA